MFTTASMTVSATSAMPSGPRAAAGVASVSTITAATASTGRRNASTDRTTTADMVFRSPRALFQKGGFTAHCPRRGDGARARASAPIRERIGAEKRLETALIPHPHRTQLRQPDQPPPHRTDPSRVRERRDQLRINQTSSTPSAAHTRPTTRSDPSGVSITVAEARFAGPGNAAKIRPSMTRTRAAR